MLVKIVWDFFRSMAMCKMTVSKEIVHIHISAAERFFLVGFLIRIMVGNRSSIITIHSGRIESIATNMAKGKVKALGWLLRRFDKLIVVNERQKELLNSIFKISEKSIEVIPAFLPPSYSKKWNVIPKGKNRLIVASGYGTPIYGYEVLIDAVSDLFGQGIKFETFLVLYTESDPIYKTKIREKAAEIGVHIVGGMPPDDFISLLMQTHIFVRPTFTDGDSNALREAHWAGAHVIASDCVNRPKWSHLFSCGDSKSLSSQISHLINKDRPGPSRTNNDIPKSDIIDVYRMIISDTAKQLDI
jgi:glycosyltransferase involved in cell wall biosynthesis